MEQHHYRYVRTAHTAPKSGFVGIVVENEGGIEFVISLTSKDANRLLSDLQDQIRIAAESDS